MKLAIFDIDGTLTATNDVDSLCFEKAVRQILKLERFDTNWANYPYVTDTGIVEEVSQLHRGRSISEAELNSLLLCFLGELEDSPRGSFQPIAGANEFLQYLRCSGEFAVALATGAWRESAQLKLHRAGIDVSEIILASSSDAIEREEIMQLARERASCRYQRQEFEEIVYFGDAAWDVRATRNLGWRLIGIGERYEMLMEMGVESAFRDYSDRRSILHALGHGEMS